jgi:hypothetical protein
MKRIVTRLEAAVTEVNSLSSSMSLLGKAVVGLEGSLQTAWSSLDTTIQGIYDYIECKADGIYPVVTWGNAKYCTGDGTSADVSYINSVTLDNGCGASATNNLSQSGDLIVNVDGIPYINKDFLECPMCGPSENLLEGITNYFPYV